MEIERVFLNSFSIEKKPDDICQLIEAAIYVAAFKYPLEFEKRKDRLLKMIMHPQPQDIHDEDDITTLDEEEDSVGDEDGVKEAEKEEEEGLGTQQITAQTKKPVLKFKIIIRKPVQPGLINKTKETDKPVQPEVINKSSETDKPVQPELIKKSWETNNTSVASTKTERVQVAPPPVRLVSDYSFEKQLDRDKQRQKQSHKGFKKMESDHDTEKKREEQTPTQHRTKECTIGSTKMNVDTKRVQVAPPRKELSDCSPQKQRNCSSIIKKAMQKETENSAVVRPMQKETESIGDMKKFESSKRKFTERLAEQREAKRRIVMVDFHDMPKRKDPRAPTRRCWSRKRF